MNKRSVALGAFVVIAMGLAVVLVTALGKGRFFGGWIALAGCYAGLHAARSAAGVGEAATLAVVRGIVGVIALDAVFAVVANAMGW